MDNLLREFAAFMARHDMEDSAFGRMVAGDSSLVFDLRDGRKLRKKTITRYREKMAEYEKNHGHGRTMVPTKPVAKGGHQLGSKQRTKAPRR